MKKIIFLLSFSFCILSCFAQDSTKKIVDSASLSWGKVYYDAKSAISAVASALKVGTEHVYEVLVKQQIVKSITWLISDICFLISLVFLLRQFKKVKSWDCDDFNQVGLGCIFLSLLSFVLMLCFFSSLSSMVTGFVNPEYGAIHEILDKISGK